MAKYSDPYPKDSLFASIKDIDENDSFTLRFDEAILSKLADNTYCLYGWFNHFTGIVRAFGSNPIPDGLTYVLFHGGQYKRYQKLAGIRTEVEWTPTEFEKLLVKHFDGHPDYWMPPGMAIAGELSFSDHKGIQKHFTNDALGIDSDYFAISPVEIDTLKDKKPPILEPKSGGKSGGVYKSASETLNERLFWLKAFLDADLKDASDTALYHYAEQIAEKTNHTVEAVRDIYLTLLRGIMR